ncbi:hypothetical protein TWF225_005190 [Orbilia oligospora]|uniref:Uncharacterized protein n=1 Tax=Orbilia oligospora TaxID=2813651 RepID=A0A7C8PQC0_ORBOL|nr:hypothetical protein TWF751_005770 [Orbilia oligospora]KAF3185401.1 hypothetical protein TWF225_005190 [Orbilia oligospora]KAF3252445.1 hypothetical protein TWF128_006799 [Orbilia oligospora]KAF3258148.1 hypothetical protein TWF217_005841 [Orbilia oligospora]KAF3287744.1 hypothetical protein TWF132_008268 [Orbilia oligospora]
MHIYPISQQKRSLQNHKYRPVSSTNAINACGQLNSESYKCLIFKSTMPRCRKVQNRSIHESIAEQKYQISKELEILKQLKENSSTWSLEDEKESERLSKEIIELSCQSVVLYNQFVVSPERLGKMRISYRELCQIWLI